MYMYVCVYIYTDRILCAAQIAAPLSAKSSPQGPGSDLSRLVWVATKDITTGHDEKSLRFPFLFQVPADVVNCGPGVLNCGGDSKGEAI